MYIHCHGIFATYTPFCFPNPQVSLVTKISWFCLERFDGNVIQEAHNLAGHPQIASLVYRLTMVRSSTQFHFYVYYVFYTHIYIYIRILDYMCTGNYGFYRMSIVGGCFYTIRNWWATPCKITATLQRLHLLSCGNFSVFL